MIAQGDGVSQLTLGGVNNDQMLPYPSATNKKLYYYNNLHDDSEWGSEIRNIFICDPAASFSLDNGYKTYAIVDTFSPYIQLPKENFKKFTDYLLKKYPYMSCADQVDGNNVCKAADRSCELIQKDFYNITLRFSDDLGFHIPPSSYLKTIDGQCHVLIIYYSGLQNIILGDVFLENYYTVYDYEDTTIGFNGWVETELPIEPPRPPRQSHTQFTIYIIVIGSLFVIGIAVALWYYCKNHKLNNRLTTQNLISGEDQFETKNVDGAQRRQTYHQDFTPDE